MTLKYRLVQRRNLGKDQIEVPKKMYAQMIDSELVKFEDLVEEIGDSTVAGSAGVKAVLDRLNVTLVRHLRNGRRVSVGELGIFRLCFGSSGVVHEKDFKVSLLHEPHVRFMPGKALRTMKGLVNFERILKDPSVRVDPDDKDAEIPEGGEVLDGGENPGGGEKSGGGDDSGSI